MVRRRVRDIYGNWIWSDDEEEEVNDENVTSSTKDLSKSAATDGGSKPNPKEEITKLQWRDWIALTIATLETILLPVVVMIAILIVLTILFSHFA